MNCVFKRASLLSAAFLVMAAAAVGQYSLEQLSGLSADHGAKLNNLQQVVAGKQFWDKGVVTELSGIAGGFTQTSALNNRGEIAGNYISSGSSHAAVWQNGLLTPLAPLTPNASSQANSINDLGQIVGTSSVAGGETHAVYWSNAGAAPIDIGTLPNLLSTSGSVINNHGMIAGVAARSAQFTFSRVAFVYEQNAITQVGGFSNIYGIYVNDINDAGVVVGAENGYSFYYDGTYHEFGEFGYQFGGAVGINASNEIIGTSYVGNESRSYLYVNGVMTDLNSLFPTTSSSNRFRALDINDRGDLLLTDNNNHLFLARTDNPHQLPGLSAVPEPSVYGCTAALGLVGLALRRHMSRRRQHELKTSCLES